jgi:hypothetical protein
MEKIRFLFNRRVIGAAFLIAFIMFCFMVFVVLFVRSGTIPASQGTAVLSVIPAPMATQTRFVITPLNSTTAALKNLPTPPLGVIAIGAYVQVTGTGIDGLRLRDEPGLDGQVQLLGSEAEVFLVFDGPRESDNYTWWYLVGPYDESRKGWAVTNYLSLVQNPE